MNRNSLTQEQNGAIQPL